jgi:hypothetical protein
VSSVAPPLELHEQGPSSPIRYIRPNHRSRFAIVSARAGGADLQQLAGDGGPVQRPDVVQRRRAGRGPHVRRVLACGPLDSPLCTRIAEGSEDSLPPIRYPPRRARSACAPAPSPARFDSTRPPRSPSGPRVRRAPAGGLLARARRQEKANRIESRRANRTRRIGLRFGHISRSGGKPDALSHEARLALR